MPTEYREAAVRFEGVSKQFRLREGNTLKEFLPAVLRRRAWSPAIFALNDVSFGLERGEMIGVIGRNGSGKSTLLKITAGVMAPSKGLVSVWGRVSPLLELGAGFHPDLTGRENVYLNASILGMSRGEVRERLDEIVAFAGLDGFMDTPVKRFSSGMFVRLAFSVAVYSDPDILLIDEALAVGDASFQAQCQERMREFHDRGVTILLASHNLQDIIEYCDRALLLDHGRLIFDGDPTEAVATYQRMMAQHATPVAAGFDSIS